MSGDPAPAEYGLARPDLSMAAVFTVLYFSGAVAIGVFVYFLIWALFGNSYAAGSQVGVGVLVGLFAMVIAFFLAMATAGLTGVIVGYPIALLARRWLMRVEKLRYHLIVNGAIGALTALVLDLVYLLITDRGHLVDAISSPFGLGLMVTAAGAAIGAWLTAQRIARRRPAAQPLDFDAHLGKSSPSMR